jgi:hypothetical protein
MLRYDVDDELWAFHNFYDIKKRDMFYKFDDVLRISCYVLWSMKVKCYWAMHDHESKNKMILYHEAWAWTWMRKVHKGLKYRDKSPALH